MVGVPGKSKGCNTCRKRKIACGLQRPVCVQCVRSSRVCGGYQREKVFVLVDPGSSCSKKRRTILGPDEPGNSHSGGPSSLSGSSISPTQQSYTYTPPYHPLTETSPAYGQVLRSRNRHDMLQMFIGACFPPPGPHQTHSKPWLLMLSDLPVRVAALDTSGVALGAAALGRMHNMPHLIHESSKLYAKGLGEVQAALRSKRLMHEDGTFAACMSLCLYEIIECPNDGAEGYNSHTQGLLALVHARGVAAHTSGAGHEFFVGTRLPGVLNALERESPNFLSDPIWMEGPWEFLPKTPVDRVVDCMAHAPDVFQKSHAFPFLERQQQVELAEQLIRQTWGIDDALQGVYDDIHMAASGPLYWRVYPQVGHVADVEGPDALFPVAYHFTDLMSASALVLCWASRVMLWYGLCELYRLVGVAPPDHSPEERPRPRSLRQCTNYLDMVNNVCQSVDYFLQDNLVMSGAFYITPALSIVMATIKKKREHFREVAWMRAALDMVSKRGLRILAHKRP